MSTNVKPASYWTVTAVLMAFAAVYGALGAETGGELISRMVGRPCAVLILSVCFRPFVWAFVWARRAVRGS